MKLILLLVVALLVVALHVEADFMYNRILPTEEELANLGLKCIPGRTVIRIEERKVVSKQAASDEEEHDTLRTHMNAVPNQENCRICVCSVEGKDEYCSRRPARNVNECIRMGMIRENLEKNLPYSHERTLAYRIRRDYIWHDDEIPYEATASCRRGRSYYSNSVNANDTDIDVASDVDSLLDYSNKDVCYYCVCALDGKKAGCITRDSYFCDYFRTIRYPDEPRNEYREMFKQDRPAYFRQLSYRLRRKMDEGVFDLMETGGDTLCCDHPDGHRRNLHEQVRNKIRLMRRKVPKENIMSGSPGVGSGLEDRKCIPYISEYTDCTDANICSGCTRCGCNETGQWQCQQVIDCPIDEGTNFVDDVILENALDVLYEDVIDAKRKKTTRPGSLVPAPPSAEDDLLLVPETRPNVEDQLRQLFAREKRSLNNEKNNTAVKFYETVDEINEDTLSHFNFTGTIEANKQEMEKIPRRTDMFVHNNASGINALHIEYSKPHELEHHLAENKIDSKHPTEDKINGLTHEEIHKMLGNYSQIIKDKELSKLVVNELTRGAERIGDKNIVPVSNITFTPENDTLTAMTFIAGNLLNKIWDMEKDPHDGSYETEIIKHEKINDLLELFKEPLSIRQENFLKNALEKLSRVIDRNKDIKNMSLCAIIEDSETIKPDINNCTEKSNSTKEHDSSMVNTKINSLSIENKNKASVNAMTKINDVLYLMQKYEHLQKKMNDMARVPEFNVRKSTNTGEENISKDENVVLNLFGKLLEKITNILSPNKKGKSITNRIQTYHMLRKDDIAKNNLEKIFNIKLPNSTLGAKDRMISDYLNNIEKHPNCFFSHLQRPVVTPLSNVEGSILYNLSEFFKIKSFTDLLNIVNDKPNSVEYHSTTSTTTATYPTSARSSEIAVPNLRVNSKINNLTLESAKEKLKNDIQNILQDLLELQKEHGIKTKNNINIANALPCIYNILKSDNDNTKEHSKNKVASTSVDKIGSFIDALKLDMKFISPNRRSNSIISPRPKSAIVWERAIKNLDKKHQKTSRRYLNENLKTHKELKDMMDKVESSSNTYKNFALHSGVTPSDSLILLKTLQADVKQYMNVLVAIQKSFTVVTNLASDKQNEFNEFVDNAATNINLNKKLVTLISKFKKRATTGQDMKPKSRTISESDQPLIMVPKWVEANDNINVKVKRDQIMNQLMMNRLRLYIKTKERTETDLNANANYNIARRILFHLENGNVALAKELYKVFLANNKQHSNNAYTKSSEYHNKESFENTEKMESRHPRLFKDPVVRDDNTKPWFRNDDAKTIKMLTRDYFFKQLWNLKELKE